MIHLRIVAPAEHAKKALELLCADRSAVNVVALPGAAKKPEGDVILCDVTPEDASAPSASQGAPRRSAGLTYPAWAVYGPHRNDFRRQMECL